LKAHRIFSQRTVGVPILVNVSARSFEFPGGSGMTLRQKLLRLGVDASIDVYEMFAAAQNRKVVSEALL
jgi:hypothetical protein